MSSQRRAGAKRSLVFVAILLFSAALARPALAQIEQVVVTAQKKTEDVQTVPIAVTAFTGEELKSGQIDQLKDLQFHAPNVTYNVGEYGTADFQIRGIGYTGVGHGNESGVAVDFDEVYLLDPLLTESSYYDLSDLEILAGPQSTLFGRGATGGAVNANIVKPDLEQLSAELNATYGNYDAMKLEGAVNLPIVTDQLGLRIAGEWDKRDGFVTDIYNDSHIDGLDQYSVRGTLRWQPTDTATVDLTGLFSSEDDSHMRSDRQLCTQDPTGVLGCLPNSAGTQTVNGNALQSTLGVSQQGITSFLEAAPPYGLGVPAGIGGPLGQELGLYNIAQPFTLPSNYVAPTGDRQVSSDFTPLNHTNDNFLSLKWQQHIANWLDSTLIAGYDHASYFTEQNYTNIAGYPFPTNSDYNLVAPGLTENCAAALGALPPSYTPTPNLNCAQLVFPAAVTAFAENAYLTAYPGQTAAAAAYAASYLAHYAPYLSSGQVPFSGFGNFGETGGNYGFTPNNEDHDLSDGEVSQYSAEWRLATSFSGPLNGLLGLYYLHARTATDYYVTSSAFDYLGLVAGGLAGSSVPSLCAATGCIFGPSYYHDVGNGSTLTSKAIFGELYYDAIPDVVKFTAGLRFTDDQKFNSSRIVQPGGLYPIGTTSKSAIQQQYVGVSSEFSKYTGRFVADWTPQLDFTDHTLLYASYSRGYKAGGANPGYLPTLPISPTYAPEFIDAYELGTKNQMLGNTLQANGDIYYYNYSGLQVAAIEDNTSVNENINARLWGAEGSFLWQPTERWLFGLNFAHEESSIANAMQVDERNPTGGDPNTLLIKSDNVADGTVGQNCVAYGHWTGSLPTQNGVAMIAPPGGPTALAQYGIAHAAFGDCGGAPPAGYSWTNSTGGTILGQPVSLNGNELQNTPQLSVGLTGQYIQPLPGDYSLVTRVDFHWQSHMWGRIFEDGADMIGAETVTNASLQLNSPDGVWYAQAFVKNIFNAVNLTGEYLNSSSSGLFTNAFYGDPRTYGVAVGAKLD